MEVKMEQKKDTKKKRLVGLEKRKARAGYLFCMPFILGFLLFMLSGGSFHKPAPDSGGEQFTCFLKKQMLLHAIDHNGIAVTW